MNNKQLGTAFEREICAMLKEDGWWVHFISPDVRGAQPFDIIAVKDGYALAADCKTTVDPIFRWDRLEWNQRMAFDLWVKCGNQPPQIFIKYNNDIYMIPYYAVKVLGAIDLRNRQPWCRGDKA